jgi:hypothetical protein
MGTRHLIIVRADKKLKVAQYGQWDGMPSGQGERVLAFLKRIVANDGRMNEFHMKLRRVHFMTAKQLDAYWAAAGADKRGMIGIDDADKAKAEHPELSRDTGAKILEVIYNNEKEKLGLDNAISFLTEFDCEWAYEIDLDKKRLLVYRDGRSTPLREYSFDKLPTQSVLNKLDRN